jgi:predicted nucleic acid-binding protein
MALARTRKTPTSESCARMQAGIRRSRRPGLGENPLLSSSQLLSLDTSAFIYFLTGREPYLTLLLPLFKRVQQGQTRVVVSTVTEAELLVRHYRDDNAEAVERVEDLLSEAGIRVLPVDRRTARGAALLRARHSLRLPDAIIVATAVEAECEAIVGNDGAWRKLTEIPYVNLDDSIAQRVSGRRGVI